MKATFRHALVIGKFYPPHNGHEYLIRTAASAAVAVTVVVMAADVESIALSQRVRWLREICDALTNVRVTGVVDNVPVDYENESVWARHVELMRIGIEAAEQLREMRAGPIDAVFTSERYGAELARRFDAASVCLDESRALHPVSGTAVRRDPPAHWNDLAACVRADLCRRIAIVGAESTGKTTLAAALAQKFRERGAAWASTRCIAEFGREYTINKLAIERALADTVQAPVPSMMDLRWTTEEFTTIALEQQRREDLAARSSGPLLICDTDAFATAVWHERYVGNLSRTVAAIVTGMPPRLGYILTSWQEVTFEQDGVRDGETVREWMHDTFVARLNQSTTPWILVEGDLEQRINHCMRWIDTRLSDAWQFAQPLG